MQFGKEMEAKFFGEAQFRPENESIIRLNRRIKLKLGAILEQNMQPSDFKGRITKELISQNLETWSRNPYTLKIVISNLENLLKKANNPAEATKLREELTAIKSFVNKLKTSMEVDARSTGRNLFTDSCKLIADIQKAEPIRTPFKESLVSDLRRRLERSGVDVQDLNLFTTVASGEKEITWPDYFGADAFVGYKFGDGSEGMILIDGTTDPKKHKNQLFQNTGLNGFNGEKLILQFDPTIPDEELGSKFSKYIHDEVVPKIEKPTLTQ